MSESSEQTLVLPPVPALTPTSLEVGPTEPGHPKRGPWPAVPSFFLSLFIFGVMAVSQLIAMGGAIIALIVYNGPDAYRFHDFVAMRQLAYHPVSVSAGAIFGGIVTVALTLLMIRVRKGPGWKSYLALHPATRVAWLASILAMVVALALSFVLDLVADQPPPAFVLDLAMQLDGPLMFAGLLLALCVFAPISEEILFRGFLYDGLVRSRLGVTGAIIISTMLFTLVHSQYESWVLIGIFLEGLAMATARAVSHSLYPAIAVHGTINFLSLMALYS